MSNSNPTMERLEDQISWYDKKSQYNQNWFRRLKVLEIIFAAVIPFAAGYQWSPIFVGLLGVLIVVIEGLQSLNQYQNNWFIYRSTCEYLKHEKHLFLGSAGPYRGVTDAMPLLAERIETLVSQEHARWISFCEKSVVSKKI